MEPTKISIETLVHAPIEKVWEAWTKPEHVTKWNFASDDWHCPRGENNLTIGGTFSYRMEAKDGSFGFDFGGTYTDIVPNEKIAYVMGDGRKVETFFKQEADSIKITTIFDAETENSVELQKNGWQAILNNFKKYVESI